MMMKMSETKVQFFCCRRYTNTSHMITFDLLTLPVETKTVLLTVCAEQGPGPDLFRST